MKGLRRGSAISELPTDPRLVRSFLLLRDRTQLSNFPSRVGLLSKFELHPAQASASQDLNPNRIAGRHRSFDMAVDVRCPKLPAVQRYDLITAVYACNVCRPVRE